MQSRSDTIGCDAGTRRPGAPLIRHTHTHTLTDAHRKLVCCTLRRDEGPTTPAKRGLLAELVDCAVSAITRSKGTSSIVTVPNGHGGGLIIFWVLRSPQPRGPVPVSLHVFGLIPRNPQPIPQGSESTMPSSEARLRWSPELRPT